MAAPTRPDGQTQRPSSSDEDVVFVGAIFSVGGVLRGAVGTRSVVRGRPAGPVRAVFRGGARRGRPLLGAWAPRAPLAPGSGGAVLAPRSGGAVLAPRSGGAVLAPRSGRRGGGGAKRPRSPSSSDDDLVCLGEVVAGTGKFIPPRCVS
jgi:hypothetical protein